MADHGWRRDSDLPSELDAIERPPTTIEPPLRAAEMGLVLKKLAAGPFQSAARNQIPGVSIRTRNRGTAPTPLSRLPTSTYVMGHSSTTSMKVSTAFSNRRRSAASLWEVAYHVWP